MLTAFLVASPFLLLSLAGLAVETRAVLVTFRADRGRK